MTKKIFQLALFWLAAAPLFAQEGAQEGAKEALPQVRFETNRGSFDVELYPERAPITVSNFLSLIEAKFYDDMIFHRVIAGFMIQTGGFDKNLRYRDTDKTIVNESPNGLFNKRGYLAMARTSDPDSASSQFFVNVSNNASLNAKSGRPGYAVFGKVIDGYDVVEDIELSDTTGRPEISEAVPDIPIVILRARRL
jgi:peptidyl-prolyl cis-trans isomerase A (cyclophilin A)